MSHATGRSGGQRRRAMTALLLLSLLLALTACGGQPKPVDRFTGTAGITIQFAQNAPPETVYENTAFPVRVLVRDAGATDVPYDKLLLTFSVDPLYLSGGISPYFPNRHDPDSIAERRTAIYGKSPGYPDGELLAYGMPMDSAFSANPVVGQRESPETRILAGVCYAYATYYAASICVDTNAYAENLRDQPCEAKDLAPTGGQGAPVAVTGVRVQSLPVVDRTLGLQVTRPYVTITIENVGGGQVVGPDTLDLASACLLRDIPKEELGAVRVSASLLKSPLECQPAGLVRLTDGKGEIRCTVPESALGEEQYAATQNYLTTLVVNLTYLYKDTAEATIKIARASLSGADGTFLGGRMTGYEYIRAGATPPQAVLPGYDTPQQLTTIGRVITDSAGLEWEMLGTSDGQPVSSCDLYAHNPDLVPSDRPLVAGALTPQWSCACGQTRCATLSRSGQCLAGLCPAGTYCCTDQKATTTTGTATGTPTGEGTASGSGTPGDLLSWKESIIAGACGAGVYPSIVAAQFQLESQAGSRMPPGSNNPFGIKCGDASRCVSAGTSECTGSACAGTTASFRVFDSVDQAIAEQGGRLMGTVPGLSSRITVPFSERIHARDRDGAIRTLQGTYATDPLYASKLSGIIRTKGLASWDACIS